MGRLFMVETGETPTPDTYFLRRDHGGKKRGVFRLSFDIV
tara:strand:+ start:1337 stop:1456 length:120 start_codon:yes stop_codon:yes gene_type:complete